jgi:Fe-S-cluster containining protein
MLRAMPAPCDACIAGCCRGYNVVLDGYDAWRIATVLRLPPSDFCELPWSATREGAYRVLLNALPGVERRYYRLALRRVPADPPWDKRCIFLLTVGQRGRCGIYDLRPSVCATYPTGRTGDAIDLTAGGQYCPPGAWRLDELDVPAFRLRHRVREARRRVWDALVDGWNARLERDAAAVAHALFYRFVLDAYADLNARAPSLLDDRASLTNDAAIADTVAQTLSAIA